MDLDLLEMEVKKRKQGMITLENVYVVLLVAAWASIVLLIIILIIGVTIALNLPPNFGSTITDGYHFFLTVANGWNAGVLEISRQSPNSQSPSNIEYMISELVQLIHGLDVPALLHVCPTNNILHSFDFLLDVPSFVADAKDIVSFAVTNVKWLPLVSAVMPLEYYFPTERQAPPTMQLTMDPVKYTMDGYWTDMNVVEFIKADPSTDDTWKLHEKLVVDDDIDGDKCSIYDIKSYTKAFGYHTIKPSFITNYTFNGNMMVSNALRYGIKMRNEINVNNVKEFRLSLESVKFYHPIIVNYTDHFVPIVLHKTMHASSDVAVFENEAWILVFDESIVRWVLYKKEYEPYVYDRFRDILPLKLHQEMMPNLAHNTIGNMTINHIIVRTNINHHEYNGGYTLYEPTQHKTTANGIKISSISNHMLDEEATIYYREILDGHKIFHYQLIHDMRDGILHKWMLKKYVIEAKHVQQRQQCYAQIASESLKISRNNSQWTLETNSQFEDVESGYIQSIVIEYVLNPVLWYSTMQNINVDRNIYRQYFCAPAVHFKMNTMYLKMSHKMAMFEWIPVAMPSVNVTALRCKPIADMNSTYLKINNIVIKSDMFGGQTPGKVHFHFKNLYVCQQFIKTVKSHHNMGALLYPDVTVSRLVSQACKVIKDQKETAELAKIAMNELLGNVRGFQILRWFDRFKTPNQLCDWLSSAI